MKPKHEKTIEYQTKIDDDISEHCDDCLRSECCFASDDIINTDELRKNLANTSNDIANTLEDIRK